ncbi:short-chain dehydrogenase, putative [Entamoeba dispar SAW760]|uniref:Short-chain dehydrogenase, putative n=1 Tax=Entamoeba dispar (strain ATCC PRA-260 / SAW760) TaxID=370354 RepID=B0ESU6_ENTDS|nr:short-chain dehydrogenase, putative [Entamoeba dispar SAW760]EDR22398.1 short-chain dehydrogenase, putative [Entamoeba dispar SAW760]|eukprot:EDR22398.1 short-chain dehydrogenase, putative [Entamoeba dispar SAW760]
MQTDEKKVAFVTGSTDGIGLFTATKLARDGYKVIIHGRTQEKVDKAMNIIQSQVPEADLDFVVCDLQSIKNTKMMCDLLLSKYQKLDLLLNNAGVFILERQESVDGHEMTLAVNVLAPFIITCKLLPLIRKTLNSRIIEVGSISQPSYMDLDLIEHKTNYDGYRAYDYSKLSVIAFTFELTERYPDLWINTLDPGTVNTKMLILSWGKCGIEVGEADDEYWLATNEDLQKVRGKYFVNKVEEKAEKQAYDLDFRKKLFLKLEEITGIKYPLN